ncbi:MAG TPA: pyruvate formate-lyase-activating protein [Clostridiales bacterium]|nr:MAG: Pyruvate formate-lyase 1-activating enzyme [Firmicutes bacterium ADurb.Bin262]HOU10582.1 pyruvate formate-lyase-activating protein [Clostridiales bacterium]HQH63418.1 pyruvate formate-lyase-activating protein [Clostridiales bacterium]HQK74289.1 pyruvate formate-lyase-activating protein [Clostridiales bacterium]
MMGAIASFQSMGAVDGPGLRCAVFMQGCPLRCQCCHNPETWVPGAGTQISVEELTDRILRYRSYIKKGGVTVSGGEPLLQAAFVAELFRRLRQEGIHTALDTSGYGDLAAVRELLNVTDLVICDIKFTDETIFERFCGGQLQQVYDFLALTAEMRVPLWLRQVIIPGLNDNEKSVLQLKKQAALYPNAEKIELLPFRKLCVTKYEELGIPFPLEDTPECPDETIRTLKLLLSETENSP